MNHSRPLWMEIDLEALLFNLRTIKKILPAGTKVLALVKADAYGHGAVEVAKALVAGGADYLGVAFTNEGIELREAGVTAPVLVLGWTPTEDFRRVVENDLVLTIYDYEDAAALNICAGALRKKTKVHLKLDTGLTRLGFLPNDETLEKIIAIAEMPFLEIEGIYSHFAKSDDEDKSTSYKQLEIFAAFVEELEKEGVRIPIRHMSNSGGVVGIQEACLEMVRPGILLYGAHPGEESKNVLPELRPVMSLKGRIARVETVPAGTEVSYGGTYVTKETVRLATLPIGYGDGYSRRLSNRGTVLVGGKKCPIVGRVCMDQCVVELDMDSDVKKGDQFTVLGRDGDEAISADEIAEDLETISYEVFCALAARVPRYYLPMSGEN